MSDEIECEISTADGVRGHEYDDENDLSDVDVDKGDKFMNAKCDVMIWPLECGLSINNLLHKCDLSEIGHILVAFEGFKERKCFELQEFDKIK